MDAGALREIEHAVYYGNTVAAWAKALLTFALWFTVLPLARAFIARGLKKREAGHARGYLVHLHTQVNSTTRVFMVVVAVYLAMRWLKIPERLDRIVDTVILVVIWWQVARWVSAAVRHAIEARRGHGLSGEEGTASLNILHFVATLIVWVVAFLMLLTNLGVKIGPLIAGLGIGGVAIALAVQNVLGDLFASLSIALDKPFRIGDSLAIGDEKGTVEYVGIKSTRLRAATGEQIVISNGDLLKSRVRNFSRLAERRADLTLRIAYETPAAQVKELPRIIEAAIRAEPGVRFDRAHFARYGDYAFVFEATYVVESSDYKTFMDAQQSINLRLLDEFERRHVTLAYPTQRSLSFTVDRKEGAIAD